MGLIIPASIAKPFDRMDERMACSIINPKADGLWIRPVFPRIESNRIESKFSVDSRIESDSEPDSESSNKSR